jgi:hypothetical protein
MMCSRQKVSQRAQCTSADLAHLAVMPNRVFSLTRMRSSQKEFHFRVGTFTRTLSVGMQNQNEQIADR